MRRDVAPGAQNRGCRYRGQETEDPLSGYLLTEKP